MHVFSSILIYCKETWKINQKLKGNILKNNWSKNILKFYVCQMLKGVFFQQNEYQDSRVSPIPSLQKSPKWESKTYILR